MSRRAAVVAGACAVVLVAGAGAGAGVVVEATVGLPWAESEAAQGPLLVRPEQPPEPDWVLAPGVLGAPGVETAAGGVPLADVLAPLLDAPALGGNVGVDVVDLGSGASVYESASSAAITPASTLKILTSAAVLHVLGPDHVFTTRVVTAAPGLSGATPTITLVGAGDPSLTADDDGAGTSLVDLADATAAALTDAGVTSVALDYDASLFSGPAVDPDWSPGYVGGVVSPVSALAADLADRPGDPAQDAAETFADLLGDRGVTVASQPSQAAARADAVDVATVGSQPLSDIVETVLDTSDNDGAEVLARHVAIGAGMEGTSENAGPAVLRALGELGLDTTGATPLDGSGLARGSAVPAALVTATLTAAADPARPELRSVVTGLPVAGFTGTLADRFDGDDATAVGVVRAKTGTLTGVNALAGVVVAADGTSYAFAVLADDVQGTEAAREALDAVGAALAGCGCA
ncbi:D-alanyl-D-alanine carboxypeptidase/D-alanyl-D-alanine-endopeptidase [Jiangella asiatica]|uniref:D-alanyl-D-alanine carboxypeptidase/D-alanyl-D-alanine-endopeptidase n=1 Tax=Jiangella asiatica TaxID=2530372 RepID=A0A4R5CBQ8_9ACTN|nr:D-alanyl-D-alanine carboxypeptidase/D-alanyl-D-alanine-endopeptidase [Jiangella asiatica]TDD94522.1 D-alanyl-D-alanine carboxypeptidase/D-alanyl-D-alanine-endopeptidase [Jiangella asiatica]